MKEKIKYIARLFLGFRKDISYIFIGAITSVLAIELYLKDIPEVVSFGSEIGVLIYNISLSVIAATIFYFIVTHTKEFDDKRHIYPYIKENLYRLVVDTKHLFERMAKCSNVELNSKFPNKDELGLICKKLGVYSKSPVGVGLSTTEYLTWQQYLVKTKKQSKDVLNRVLGKIIFLDAKLISLLDKYEDNNLFDFIDMFEVYRFRNDNMVESHQQLFDEYIRLVKEIDEYISSEMKHY